LFSVNIVNTRDSVSYLAVGNFLDLAINAKRQLHAYHASTEGTIIIID